jgi:hypothetical protein
VWTECVRRPDRLVGLAHLCPETDVCVRRFNIACTNEARDADVARRTPRHDQDIRAGSNGSAFSMSILPWRSRRRWPVTYAHRANASGKDFAIGPITIANEILWRILPAKRFDELPRNPFGGRRQATGFAAGHVVKSEGHTAAEMRALERRIDQSMRSHSHDCAGTSSSPGKEVSCASP